MKFRREYSPPLAQPVTDSPPSTVRRIASSDCPWATVQQAVEFASRRRYAGVDPNPVGGQERAGRVPCQPGAE